MVTSAGKGEVVLPHFAILKSHICPFRVGFSVPISDQIVPGKGSSFGHILDILGCIEHLGHPSKRLTGVLKAVTDASFAGSSFLCGNQHDAVSGFCTLDSGASRIF